MVKIEHYTVLRRQRRIVNGLLQFTRSSATAGGRARRDLSVKIGIRDDGIAAITAMITVQRIRGFFYK